MIQLLIDLLTPIFTSMGVSTTDVQTYVNMLSGYIYTIIGLLAAAVAIMVAAHFLVKKRERVMWYAGAQHSPGFWPWRSSPTSCALGRFTTIFRPS